MLKKIKGSNFYATDKGLILNKNGKEISNQLNHIGYLTVRIKIDGKYFTKMVHRLILETFIGPYSEGMQTNHKDGNKWNNNLSNLEYMTSSENRKHAFALGLIDLKGEKGPTAKLTEEEVKEIRSLYPGTTQRKLAKRFGVGKTTIAHIVNRDNWKHI